MVHRPFCHRRAQSFNVVLASEPGRRGGRSRPGHTFAISPQVSREFCHHVPPSRNKGAGNAGRPMRPIAACAMVVTNAHALVRSHRNHPAFPTQWFYGLYRVLPGARALWSPSPVELLPRTWRQRRGVRTTRLCRPLSRRSSPALPASTASRPALMTLRNAPLVGRDKERYRIFRIF